MQRHAVRELCAAVMMLFSMALLLALIFWRPAAARPKPYVDSKGVIWMEPLIDAPKPRCGSNTLAQHDQYCFAVFI